MFLSGCFVYTSLTRDLRDRYVKRLRSTEQYPVDIRRSKCSARVRSANTEFLKPEDMYFIFFLVIMSSNMSRINIFYSFLYYFIVTSLLGLYRNLICNYIFHILTIFNLYGTLLIVIYFGSFLRNSFDNNLSYYFFSLFLLLIHISQLLIYLSLFVSHLPVFLVQ